MDLPGHHQAVLEAGHHVQACPTHPSLVVWDRHWLERPSRETPGTGLKFQPPIPQGAASLHCSLTQTAEQEPLSVSWQRGKTAASWTVSAEHTHQGRDCNPYSMTFNSSEKLRTVWRPRVHNQSVNWSGFSGGRPGWH